MDARLHEISVNGDVAALRQLLREEPLVLDTATIPVAQDTPLHIASLLGHTDLASEILRLKPVFARVRDGRGLYPLHLASAKGHAGIVKKILEVDASSLLCHDKDGRIPIHLAAANNHVALLQELLPANQSCSQALTDRGETVLHLSAKYNQFEVAKFIVENFKELINMKDESGNTVLHLATARRHIKMLKLLLQESAIEVNAMNESSCTALDLLLQCPSDISDMEVCELLLSAGGKKGRQVYSSLQQISSPPGRQVSSSPPGIRSTWKSMMPIGWSTLSKDDNWLKDVHNTMMIVSTVIAGATFQAGLNPPEGLFDKSRDPGYLISFVIFNVIALAASMLIILSLVSGLPMTWVLIITLWVAVSSMAVAFLMGANLLMSKNSHRTVTSDRAENTLPTVLSLLLFCWLLLLAMLISYCFMVLLIQFVRRVINSCNSCLGGKGNVV